MSSLENSETQPYLARYFKNLEHDCSGLKPNIEPKHSEVIGLVGCFKRELSKLGDEDKLAEVIAHTPFLEFLKQAIDSSIESCKSQTVSVPALGERYRKVNDILRESLPHIVADYDGSEPESIEVPAIDWKNQTQYEGYTFGSDKFESIAQVKQASGGCSVEILGQYVLSTLTGDITQVYYICRPNQSDRLD